MTWERTRPECWQQKDEICWLFIGTGFILSNKNCIHAFFRRSLSDKIHTHVIMAIPHRDKREPCSSLLFINEMWCCWSSRLERVPTQVLGESSTRNSLVSPKFPGSFSLTEWMLWQPLRWPVVIGLNNTHSEDGEHLAEWSGQCGLSMNSFSTWHSIRSSCHGYCNHEDENDHDNNNNGHDDGEDDVFIWMVESSVLFANGQTENNTLILRSGGFKGIPSWEWI